MPFPRLPHFRRVPVLSAVLALVAAAALLLAGGPADAGVEARTENVTASLLSERTALMPGTTNWLAVRQQIRPGWHTYWRNPGDTGLETTLAWNASPGVVPGPIVWPAPHRFEVGGLVNYGYADDVALLVPVEVAADAAGRARLSVEANWLVCADICIPESATLDIDLPIAAPGQATPIDDAAAPIFAAARAAVPEAEPAPAAFAATPSGLRLHVPVPDLGPDAVAYFFPFRSNVIDHARPQAPRVVEGGVVLDLKPVAVEPIAALEGVLVVEGTPRRAYEIVATVGAVPDVPDAPEPVAAPAAGAVPGLLEALVLAFLGGLILNLMPCVLPVLSIKALSLVGHDRDAPWKPRRNGIAYTAGVLATFAAIGAAVLALRAGGAAVGWGFQLQSPLVVTALAYLLFAVALSFAGLLPISAGRLAGVGQGLAGRSGLVGSFFTGALAVVVATPCTAPFMGAALGFAVVAPPAAGMGVFLALGLGLAAPYLLLCFTPALVHRLPRPGPWMARVSQALSFPMFASAAWLVWVLGRQAGMDAVFSVLAGMVLIAFGAWALTAAGAARGGGFWPMLGRTLALVALVAAGALGRVTVEAAPVANASITPGRLAWTPYSADALAALRAEGRPVFLNATAAWCLTCLVNERVALGTDLVADAFEARGVVAMEADWTRQDPAITALLAEHGRSGVPLYLYFPPRGAPRILPQILTPQFVIDALGPAPAPAATGS